MTYDEVVTVVAVLGTFVVFIALMALINFICYGNVAGRKE